MSLSNLGPAICTKGTRDIRDPLVLQVVIVARIDVTIGMRSILVGELEIFTCKL